MYICLMPLFKWELAEVDMVEVALGGEQAAGGQGGQAVRARCREEKRGS